MDHAARERLKKALESGLTSDVAAVIVDRLRSGELSESYVKVAAELGDPAARLVFPTATEFDLEIEEKGNLPLVMRIGNLLNEIRDREVGSLTLKQHLSWWFNQKLHEVANTPRFVRVGPWERLFEGHDFTNRHYTIMAHLWAWVYALHEIRYFYRYTNAGSVSIDINQPIFDKLIADTKKELCELLLWSGS